jgi:hypothetical protein
MKTRMNAVFMEIDLLFARMFKKSLKFLIFPSGTLGIARQAVLAQETGT